MNDDSIPNADTENQEREEPFAANPAGESAEPVGSETPETRDEELQRLRQSADSAEKRVLLAQAEAENFRKRMRRDFEDQLRFAAMPLVADLLPVRDNLIRALEAAENASDPSGLVEGVSMVIKQLDDTLAKYNVREIQAEGEMFDPNFHEAISQMPSEDHQPGLVLHVAQTGFQMHDRVIRPSQVVVSG